MKIEIQFQYVSTDRLKTLLPSVPEEIIDNGCCLNASPGLRFMSLEIPEGSEIVLAVTASSPRSDLTKELWVEARVLHFFVVPEEGGCRSGRAFLQLLGEHHPDDFSSLIQV